MDKRKRNVGINVRVTTQEKKRITSLAKKCKLSVSEYLRQRALGYSPRVLFDDEIYQDCRALQLIIDECSDPILKGKLNEILKDLYSICYPESEVKGNGNNKDLAGT